MIAVGIWRGRGGDLLVQLGDQKLAHLRIAEPRQQVAQGLPGQWFGQSGWRACCDLLGGGCGSLRPGLPGLARQTRRDDHDRSGKANEPPAGLNGHYLLSRSATVSRPARCRGQAESPSPATTHSLGRIVSRLPCRRSPRGNGSGRPAACRRRLRRTQRLSCTALMRGLSSLRFQLSAHRTDDPCHAAPRKRLERRVQSA